MNEACSACRYFNKEAVDSQEREWGSCRINPPVVICMLPGAQYPETHWPQVEGTNWCGKFTARPSTGDVKF